MFEAAELGRKISRKEYKEREPALRRALIAAQVRLREADFPVLVVFAGVDGAGKGETANRLTQWMDPRRIDTHAYGEASQEEAERPPFWRYWRDLPAHGSIGVFLSAWYSEPLLARVYGEIDADAFEVRLDRIADFERTLARGGALIVKFWMHLGRQAQRKRLKALEADPLQSWRVNERDWKHWKMYDRFVEVAERGIMRTSHEHAPWHLVEGADERYRNLEVGTKLLEAIERRLDRGTPEAGAAAPVVANDLAGGSVLASLGMSKQLSRERYERKFGKLQGRLNLLQRRAREAGTSSVIVFEGWDASGKGGAIRRLTSALDARDYRVVSIAAPSDEERSHHWMWRFWRQLPRAGRIVIFDRSWYGRVLVERVEGLATETQWRRAYSVINDFEDQLVRHGTVLVKLWLHITKDEQLARFKARADTPHKRWKLTDEDWRNREKWDAYETAVDRLIERTSTPVAPWHLIEANDKRYARIEVLDTVCDAVEAVTGGKRGKRKRRGR